MSGRSRVAVVALLAVLTVALTASARADVPLPQYATLTISQSGEHVLPWNVAVRVGQPVVLNVYNYSREFHTFTVPALGVSALIKPALGDWPRVTTVRFTVQKHNGPLRWACVICPSGVHRVAHEMRGKIFLTVA